MNNIPEDKKNWIDSASYETLLNKWRFEPSGSEWFQGELGKYYQTVMFRKRDEVGHDGAVRASKNIGWDN